MNTKTKTIIKFSAFVILLILLTIIFRNQLAGLLSSPEKIKDYIKGFGIFAPIIFIGLTVAQVLFAPIPGQASGIAGGYIFGFYLGILYSMIGLVIGSFITFYLSRKLGRPFVEKVIDKKTFEKYDNLISTKGTPLLFLIYLLPALPDDIINYIVGLTKIKIKNLMIISAIGRLPGFVVLSFIGAGLGTGNTGTTIWISAIVAAGSILLFLNRKKLENQVEKIIQNFNQEGIRREKLS